MDRLARMRCAGQRDLRRRQRKAIGGAAFDQRQRLQRLDGGARENRRRDIAERKDVAPSDVADRDGAAMPAFDAAAAQNFNQNRIVHALSPGRRTAFSSP